jgi:hypothetical protein
MVAGQENDCVDQFGQWNFHAPNWKRDHDPHCWTGIIIFFFRSQFFYIFYFWWVELSDFFPDRNIHLFHSGFPISPLPQLEITLEHWAIAFLALGVSHSPRESNWRAKWTHISPWDLAYKRFWITDFKKQKTVLTHYWIHGIFQHARMCGEKTDTVPRNWTNHFPVLALTESWNHQAKPRNQLRWDSLQTDRRLHCRQIALDT